MANVPKPYELEVVLKEGYLHATVRGANSAEAVLGYLSEIREACLRRGYKRVLIEENLQGPGLGTVNVFEVTSTASARTWPAVLRIAFVDVNPEHDPAAMKFAETVARNRGINVRVFSRVDEAEKWFASEPTDGSGTEA